jgi:YfiH family protein
MNQRPEVDIEGGFLIAGSGRTRRLTSPLLTEIPGLAHAFTTRGSVPEESIAEAAGHPLPVVSLRQVHGAEVHALEDQDPIPAPGERPAGDVLITRRRGVGLEVRIADCVPVLLCDPVSGWIAAVHAGWRGVVAGAVTAAIRALARRGVRSADLRMALGPSIGLCCFEVGAEVVDAFRGAGVPGVAAPAEGRPARIDLPESNRWQALREGVLPRRIAASGLCTACRPDLLESHRRSRGSPGRMAAVIAWRG